MCKSTTAHRGGIMAKQGQRAVNKEPISAKLYKGQRIKIPESAGASLGVVLRGEGTVFYSGKSFPITPKHALIVVDRSIELEASEDGIEIIAVDFMSHIIGEELAGALVARGPIFSSSVIGDSIKEGIDAIHKELKSKDKYTTQAAAGRLLIIAAEISRAENEYVSGGEISSQVATAIAHITEHYQDKISLSELASVAGVSPAYLSKRFTREMGIGYADYLSLYRLTKAEKMLREEPDKTVTEVAFFCGFNDSNYFSDKFKKHFGVAPLKYRKTTK